MRLIYLILLVLLIGSCSKPKYFRSLSKDEVRKSKNIRSSLNKMTHTGF
jgi:hypothetical protein